MIQTVRLHNPGRHRHRRSRNTQPVPRHANEPGILGAAIAGDVYAAVKKALVDSGHKRASPPGKRRKKSASRKKRRRNLATLAVIGANPMKKPKSSRKRNARTRAKRNASGQFVAKAARKAARKRNRTRTTPRVSNRQRKRAASGNKPTVVIIRERNPMAKANLKRSSSRKRRVSSRRKRNLAPGLSRARGKAHAYGARKRNSSRRRRNFSVKSLTGKINFGQVLATAGGVFAGDKAVTILPNMVLGAKNTGIVATISKIGVGVLGGAALWKVSPALGTGFVIGALNGWINEGFGYVWSMASPYLGVSGLRDYRQQSWRTDNWLGARVPVAGALAAGTGVSGVGQVNPNVFKRPY